MSTQAEPAAAAESKPNDGDGTLAKVASAGKSEMLTVKRERQRAEGDVQLLMNRLKHLKVHVRVRDLGTMARERNVVTRSIDWST